MLILIRDIIFVIVRFPSETPKLYLEKAIRLSSDVLVCFLHLYDRAYVARCIDRLIPHLFVLDSNVAVCAQPSADCFFYIGHWST